MQTLKPDKFLWILISLPFPRTNVYEKKKNEEIEDKLNVVWWYFWWFGRGGVWADQIQTSADENSFEVEENLSIRIAWD